MADNQVEEVKLHTDIVTVIGERIELKKAGRNYKANCPFHGEKTASFMVSPELQIFKCFGCGVSGDCYSFLEQYEGMEFPEALKYLADKAGITLEKVNMGGSSEKERLIELNSQTLKFYNYLLLNHPVGKNALQYLLKDRGLKKETIEEFKLGFSPENSNAINAFLVKKKKFSPKEVERAGIGIPRGQMFYDRFHGRVIFPLFDHRGNVIGFAGRIIPGGRQDTAKYINSPETPIYHKSNVLFGLNLTRSFIKKKGEAIIVEGELDAISTYQAGIKNVVAIKGSSLTEEQVRLLSRFAGKFILCLDSDMAGDTAARRGIGIASNLGVEVKVAVLASFKDPDDAARNDPDGFKKTLDNAINVWDFLIESVFSRFDGKSGEGSAKISKEIVPILASIENKIVQSHYINLVARKLGVEAEAVNQEIQKVAAPKTEEVQPARIATQSVAGGGRRELLEERLLTLAFQNDPSILLDKEILSLIRTNFGKRLAETYQEFSRKNKYDPNKFGKSLPKELFDGFVGMVLSLESENEHSEQNLEKELDLVEKELKILSIKENLRDLSKSIGNLEKDGEKEKVLRAQNKFTKLAQILSKLDEDSIGSIILDED
ncbi:MAG: DNA primase [bacterium]|nr:DNA primase [bacterium]